MTGRQSAVLALCLALLGLAGCASMGARQVPMDQLDDNNAIARSMQEQMLMNIVRLRYFEAPHFLAVGSVLTQYAWQGAVGVVGQQGFGIGNGIDAPTFLGGSAAAQYVERPTVTFVPVEGDDFSRRLMTPIPLDFVFAIGEAGYPIDLLFRTGIARMNDVENAASMGFVGDLDRALQLRLAAEAQVRFKGLVDLLQEL